MCVHALMRVFACVLMGRMEGRDPFDVSPDGPELS